MDKKMISILIAVLAGFFIIEDVLAQSKYPERPIEQIIPVPAGSVTDIQSRLIGEFLSKYLGQPVVPMNRPGAAGAIGGNAMAKSKPDGYTIATLVPSQATPEYLISRENFQYTSKTIQPVAQYLAYHPGTLVTRYSDPWKSAKEFVEYAKMNPNKLKWGHIGRGAYFHVIGSKFIREAGIKMLDVVFHSDGHMMAAILGNHIDSAFIIWGPGLVPHIEGKKLKGLLYTSPRRSDQIPDLPWADELGYPTGKVESYCGVFVPKGTPKEIITKLSETVKRITEDNEFKARAAKLYFREQYRDTNDFADEVEFIGKSLFELGKEAGLEYR